MKKLIKKISFLKNFLFVPFVYTSLKILKLSRRHDTWKESYFKGLFKKVGVYPILNHYYEPFFDSYQLRKPLFEDRNLTGIDLNIQGQLDLLKNFHYNNEIENIQFEKGNDLNFFFHNGSFESGDADYLYNVIRYFKPNKIIEIGSGYSTLLAIKALEENQRENSDYSCKLTCIEPYENDWLEKTKVNLIRNKVENLDLDIFKELQNNDILFIDSSHMIKPQGDVLFEYLEILPILNPGVIVHFHDIFTPRDYPERWIKGLVLFWNEQYLLEAFLSFNSNYEIMGSLNFLKHHYRTQLFDKCPILKLEADREPGSFWIKKK